jgi:hypothetical protein
MAAAVAAHPGPQPWFGTWELNMEKSEFGSTPPNFKRAACVIEPWEDGLKISCDIVGVRGGVAHTEWSGKPDGRDYPVQGVDRVLTNAYTPIGDRGFSIVSKVEGRIEARATTTISPDGMTMTTVTTRRNETGRESRIKTVYEKRR